MTTPTYFDLAFHMDQEGIAVLGTDLFAGEFGVDVDAQTMVLEGVATPAELKELYESTAVQILVRGAKHKADYLAYAVAKTVSDFVLTLSSCVEMNSVLYKGFEASSNIAQLGKDSNERFVYSMNFTTFRNN